MLTAPPYLPSYQFHEAHTLVCSRGSPESLLHALLTQNLRQDPLIAILMRLREGIPALLQRRKLGAPAKAPTPFGLDRFTRLETQPTRITLGLVGRFWRPTFGLYPIPDRAAFMAFTTPGVAKLVLTFEAQAQPNGTVTLGTQTWVYCPDTASCLKMQLYWALIRPASGLIRGRILARAAQQA